jgi:hypothetical protein
LLLCSQRNHGVDTHGSTRWEKTRGQRDKEKQSQHREKRKRIGGGHTEKQTAHHTCQPKRTDESNDDAGGKGSLSGGLSIRHDKLRGALVITEFAISLPLLIGAGLLVRSFVRLANVPPGFNPQHVVSMDVGAYGPKFKDPTTRVQFYQELTERIRHLPGVTATGAISAFPLAMCRLPMSLNYRSMRERLHRPISAQCRFH